MDGSVHYPLDHLLSLIGDGPGEVFRTLDLVPPDHTVTEVEAWLARR